MTYAQIMKKKQEKEAKEAAERAAKEAAEENQTEVAGKGERDSWLTVESLVINDLLPSS